MNYGKGSHEAVNYLANLGHREFAFVAGPQIRPSHVAYKNAVVAALEELDLHPRLIEGANTGDNGDRAVQRLLTGRRFPTAILCSSDLTAIGALRALFRAGLRVPADVSVAGAGDIPFAALSHPPLTTVQIPRQRLGRLAFEVLLRMIRDKEPGSATVLDTEPVIRESTAPAPANAGPPGSGARA